MTGYLYGKDKSQPLPLIADKNYLQWVMDLNVRSKMIKLLEKNIEENLYDIAQVKISETEHNNVNHRRKN